MIEIVIPVIFFAAFVQASAGFGIALVAMPFLTSALGLGIAAPLVALIILTMRPIMLLRYRDAFKWREIIQLMAASIIGIAIASVFSRALDSQTIVEAALGIVVLLYAIYSLSNPQLPTIVGRRWAYSAGFISGFLARLYNIGGPPVVMYADGQRWQPSAFKGNLQLYGTLNSIIVVVSRMFNGDFTMSVLGYYLLALPLVVAGLLLGFHLERYINPLMFRKAILVMLLFVGFSLIF